jgi:hypothetical protein
MQIKAAQRAPKAHELRSQKKPSFIAMTGVTAHAALREARIPH